MIIRDKQDLRKCVKQCVRRAEVTDIAVHCDAFAGKFGVANYLNSFVSTDDSLHRAFQSFCSGSPFAKAPSVLLAALDAMQLPAHDLDKAETIISGFDRETYMDNVLNAMHARKVLIETPLADSFAAYGGDERCVPLLAADPSVFSPGRYGIDYASIARQLADASREIHARAIQLNVFDRAALEYCLLPLCEDESLVLHIHCQSEQEIDDALSLLTSRFSSVRALISASESAERYLIRASARVANVLVCLGSLANLHEALSTLGIHFMPYTSLASTPEAMLGGWVLFKEAFWEAMYEAYLPLARTGYELTREQIEKDIDMMLFGNYEQLYV